MGCPRAGGVSALAPGAAPALLSALGAAGLLLSLLLTAVCAAFPPGTPYPRGSTAELSLSQHWVCPGSGWNWLHGCRGSFQQLPQKPPLYQSLARQTQFTFQFLFLICCTHGLTRSSEQLTTGLFSFVSRCIQEANILLKQNSFILELSCTFYLLLNNHSGTS